LRHRVYSTANAPLEQRSPLAKADSIARHNHSTSLGCCIFEIGDGVWPLQIAPVARESAKAGGKEFI
jgi:hypothetical protein